MLVLGRLLLLQLVVLVWFSQSGLAEKLDEYTKVSLWLRDTIRSADLDTSMLVLNIYAETMEKMNSPETHKTIDDIRKILHANDMSKHPKCTDKEFLLLESIDESLEWRASRLHRIPTKKRRRIEYLVNKILARYSKNCSKMHERRLVSSHKNVDKQYRKNAKHLAKEFNDRRVAKEVKKYERPRWRAESEQERLLQSE